MLLLQKRRFKKQEISKVRYKIEQYFGITHKYHGAGKARFTTIIKENWDHLCGDMAFNIKRVILSLIENAYCNMGKLSPETLFGDIRGEKEFSIAFAADQNLEIQ